MTRIEAGLAQRLAPALEGRLLALDVLVDALPVRGPFGDSLTARVERCEPVMEAERSSQPAEPGCANLRRVLLGWALPRPRERDDDDPATWPQPGERWRIRALARLPSAPVNPGAFDRELRLLEEGIGAALRVRQRQRLPDVGAALWLAAPGVAIERWRAALRDRLEARVRDARSSDGGDPWQSLALATALALGDQRALSPEAWALFSRTGVSHLMSISGLHVTLLAALASGVAGWTLRRRGWRRWPVMLRLIERFTRQRIVMLIAVTCAFGYALLSGWGIASQRTCWMLLAASVIVVTGRSPGPFASTWVASAPVVLVDPWAVSAAGFWLSFGAVMALIWQSGDAHRPGEGRRRRLSRQLANVVAAQWAATVALLPLTIAWFGTASVIGPLVNLVAIPLVSLVITPASLLLTFTAAWPAFDLWTAGWFLLDWLVDRMMAGLQWADGRSRASVRIADPGPWLLAAALLGAAWLLAPRGLGARWLGLTGLLPMLLAGRLSTPPDTMRLTLFDVGLGSAVLIETADGVVLIDTGGGRPGASVAGRVIVGALARRGIDRIDALVISHRDREHAGGAADAVASLSPSWLISAFDPRWLPIDAQALRWQPCVAGQTLPIGRLRIEALWPQRPVQSRVDAADNRSSCVLRLVHPAGSVVAAGDLPISQERALLDALTAGPAGRSTPLAADVLVVPGQGSRHAGGEQLIAAVAPRVALVQTLRGQHRRAVHPDLLERLASAGVRLLRTDQHGAVILTMERKQVVGVQRLRVDRPPYWRVLGPVLSEPEP